DGARSMRPWTSFVVVLISSPLAGEGPVYAPAAGVFLREHYEPDRRASDEGNSQYERCRTQHGQATECRCEHGLDRRVDEYRDGDAALRSLETQLLFRTLCQRQRDRIDVDEASDGRHRIDAGIAEAAFQRPAADEQHRQ